MKYGVLGDIHGNLSALAKVLADMERQGVDVLLSVGDVVGYGAAPGECIDLLRKHEVHVVKGNHDAAVVGELDDRFFNAYAREAVRWTQSHLNARDRAWLAELPLTREFEHCHLAHGTLHRPELFDYVLSTTDAIPSMDLMRHPICFIGHTHQPDAHIRLAEPPHRTAYAHDSHVDLKDVAQCVFNVGSVGQPRDDDPRTGYAVYDTQQQAAWMVRLSYDIDREAKRIRAAGLPPVLAERLYLGI